MRHRSSIVHWDGCYLDLASGLSLAQSGPPRLFMAIIEDGQWIGNHFATIDVKFIGFVSCLRNFFNVPLKCTTCQLETRLSVALTFSMIDLSVCQPYPKTSKHRPINFHWPELPKMSHNEHIKVASNSRPRPGRKIQLKILFTIDRIVYNVQILKYFNNCTYICLRN